MSKKVASASVPPKVPVAAPVPAPAPVQAVAAAEAPQVEETVAPVFSLCSGGLEFFVTIPSSLQGKWIAKLNGNYNQGKKSYTFLLTHLSEVEKELKLVPGASGLKDPRLHYSVVLRGSVFGADGLAEMKKVLEPLGFVYKRQTHTFEGPLENAPKLQALIQKPA